MRPLRHTPMTMPADLPAAGEQRRSVRLPLERPARIVHADLSRAVEATLRDVSAGGLRLRLASDAPLPRDVYVMVRMSGPKGLMRLGCDVRWQVGNTAGLQFTGGTDPDDIALLLASAGEASHLDSGGPAETGSPAPASSARTRSTRA